MAEAALGKTLDELIKSSKDSKKPSKPKATKGGKASGAGKKSPAKGLALGVSKAGVGKKGQGNKGRGGGGRAAQPNPPRRNPDADGKWAHDMYRGGPARGGAAGGGRSVFTLYISNLDFKVSEADLMELFSDYNFQKCYMNYDSSGRSVGKATVVFGERGEALKAQKRYANMALDGLVMKLDLVEGPPSGKARAMQLSSGLMLTTAKKGGRGGGGKPAPGGRAFNKAFQAVESDSGGRGRRKPRGRGGRGGRAGGGDLDAELDNYMQE